MRNSTALAGICSSKDASAGSPLSCCFIILHIPLTLFFKNPQHKLLRCVQVGWYSAEYSAENDDRAFVLIHMHQHQSLWPAGTQRCAADHGDAAGRFAALDRVALHHASAQFAPG